jgi:carbon monoxide dehydrogenase subunit G
MTGDQRIAAPRQKVWDALNDPAVLKQCIPGCQSLERESDTRMKATVTIKLGPISARFNGAVTFSDVNPPNGYTISGEGQGGAAGSAKGSAKVQLVDDAGATRLSYQVDAQVGGRLAQLGGPIIDATAKQLAGAFFKKFGEIVASGGVPAGTTRTGKPSATALPAQAGSPVSLALQIFALIVAAAAGFAIGHASGGVSANWIGLSVALLVAVAAMGGFAFGRRSTTITLDADLLERLTSGGKK